MTSTRALLGPPFTFTEAVSLIQYDLDPDPEDFAGRVLELAAKELEETLDARESCPDKFLSMLVCLRVRLDLAVALNRPLKTQHDDRTK